MTPGGCCSKFHLVNTLVMQWTHWKQHRVWTKIKARAKQVQDRLMKDLDKIFPGFSRIQNHLKKTTSKKPSSLLKESWQQGGNVCGSQRVTAADLLHHWDQFIFRSRRQLLDDRRGSICFCTADVPFFLTGQMMSKRSFGGSLCWNKMKQTQMS